MSAEAPLPAALSPHHGPPPPSSRRGWPRPPSGDPAVVAQLFERLYVELRRVASGHLRHENSGHTLTPNALSHEAWFRLAGQRRMQRRNRSHFLAVASTMMRHILADHEMARRSARRDAGFVPLTLFGLDQLGAPPDRELRA